MSAHADIEHRGATFEVCGDSEGIDLNKARVTDPAALVAWAIEGATDAELAACAAAVVREQVARDDAAQRLQDEAEAMAHKHES